MSTIEILWVFYLAERNRKIDIKINHILQQCGNFTTLLLAIWVTGYAHL